MNNIPQTGTEWTAIYWKTFIPHNQSSEDWLKKMEAFIETQIALARREGAEEMKKKCLEVIPEYDGFYSGEYLVNEIRNSISSL